MCEKVGIFFRCIYFFVCIYLDVVARLCYFQYNYFPSYARCAYVCSDFVLALSTS
jgi:hypothetical protein